MTQTAHVILQGLAVSLQILTTAGGMVSPAKQGYVVAGIGIIQGVLALFNHGKKPKTADDPNEPPGAGN